MESCSPYKTKKVYLDGKTPQQSVSIFLTSSQTLGIQNALRLRIYPRTTSESRGGSTPGLYDSLVPSIDVGVRNDQILNQVHQTQTQMSLLGLVVIHNESEEGALLSERDTHEQIAFIVDQS